MKISAEASVLSICDAFLRRGPTEQLSSSSYKRSHSILHPDRTKMPSFSFVHGMGESSGLKSQSGVAGEPSHGGSFWHHSSARVRHEGFLGSRRTEISSLCFVTSIGAEAREDCHFRMTCAIRQAHDWFLTQKLKEA